MCASLFRVQNLGWAPFALLHIFLGFNFIFIFLTILDIKQAFLETVTEIALCIYVSSVFVNVFAMTLWLPTNDWDLYVNFATVRINKLIGFKSVALQISQHANMYVVIGKKKYCLSMTKFWKKKVAKVHWWWNLIKV